MRSRTSWELLAISSLLFTLSAARRESTRVPREPAEVDSVDQNVCHDRRQKVAAPEHQPAEKRAGERRQQGPEPEMPARSGVEQGEQHGGRDPAPLPLD